MAEEPYTTDGDNSSDGGEFASPDDFKVKRGSDGEVLPQVCDTALGKVKVLPMAYGDIEAHFGDRRQEVSPEVVADILDMYVLQPDLSSDAGGEVTARYVEDMKPMAPDELVGAIFEASGIDADIQMNDDGTAEVSVGN